LAAGGLDPVGTRVTSSGGTITVTDGPFTEAKETILSFALVEARSKEEVIELSRRFWQIAGSGEGHIQQVYGPEEALTGPDLRDGRRRCSDRLVGVPEAHRVIDAVWRLESARIIAGLARLVNDVGVAEELAQDALVAALRQWPESGIPPNPGAWLTATARHQSIDLIRRNERLGRKLEQLGHEVRQRQESAVFDGEPEFEAVISDEGVQDDLLRLMFI